MRLDQAMLLCTGDKLIDCFGQELVVKSKQITYEKGIPSNVKVGVVTTYLSVHTYDYEDLYFPDLHEESDEEKSWVDWASKHLDNSDNLSIIKYAYKQGFANGFMLQKRFTAEEQLQK